MPILSPYSCWNPYEKIMVTVVTACWISKKKFEKTTHFSQTYFLKTNYMCFISVAKSAMFLFRLCVVAFWILQIPHRASTAPFLKWTNTANISIQPTSTNHVLPSWMYCHIDIISMYFVNYIQPTMYCHVLPCINIIYNIAINIAQLKLTNFSQFLPIP